jgi:phage host-nuclease inhibitor protein Gam
MKRATKPAEPAAPTLDKAEKAMKELLTAQNRINELNAKVDKAVLAAKAKYADDLMSCELISTQSLEILEGYAKANPERFSDKRCIELTTGIIGYKLNPPAVSLIQQPAEGEPKTAFDKAFNVAMKQMLTHRQLKTYVNEVVVYSIDKKRLIAERENVAVLSLLNNCNLDITQKEVFYAKAKQ